MYMYIYIFIMTFRVAQPAARSGILSGVTPLAPRATKPSPARLGAEPCLGPLLAWYQPSTRLES